MNRLFRYRLKNKARVPSISSGSGADILPGWSTRTNFLSIISHELRTPMNGILGSLSLFDRLGLDAEQQECLKQMHFSADLMMHLVAELLDYAAIQAGQICNTPTAVDVRGSLESLFHIMARRCELKGVHWEGYIDPTVPTYLQLDSRKYLVAVGHLLDNAEKWTQTGHIRCELSMNVEHELCLILKDTGQGISLAQARTVFDPFVQGADYHRRETSGLGLGLSIARAFSRVMGGELILLNSEDKQKQGVSLMMTVPVERAQSGVSVVLEPYVFLAPQAEAAATQAPQNNAPEVSGLKAPAVSFSEDLSHVVMGQGLELPKPRASTRILIVDDNATNCFVAKGVVKKLGFQAEMALTGEAAMGLLKTESFDLVLMDCQMPIMDGFEVTRRLRQLDHPNAHMPVIALTANASAEDRQRCLDEGMNDYTTKPVQLATLEEKITHWLAIGKGV